MAQDVAIVYRDKATIITDLIAALEARLPDANVGPDAIFRILIELVADPVEALYLSQQLLHDDMFIQSASALALQRLGEMFGRQQKGGTLATGDVLFSGTGGTYIGIGTQVGAPRDALGDTLVFVTTEDGTIPNPGVPTACIAADGGAGGAIAAGTYEYAVSFVTAAGETEIGTASNALVLGASHSVDVSAVALGGAGTTGRNLYRRKDGGVWALVHAFVENALTTYHDNNASLPPTAPLDDSTAEAITLAVEAQESGIDYNVVPGGISILVDALTGVTDATNAAPLSSGSEPEDIEDFRTQLLKWVRAPMSGAPDDLVAWAESIDGIETAAVFPNEDLDGDSAPGSVTVRVSGPNATIPVPTLVADVLSLLESHDLANITILVGTFDANILPVTVVVTPDTGYTLPDISDSVKLAVAEYVNNVPVGEPVYKAGVLKSVFGLVGVENVTTTFTDTANTPTQKAVCGTVTVE